MAGLQFASGLVHSGTPCVVTFVTLMHTAHAPLVQQGTTILPACLGLAEGFDRQHVQHVVRKGRQAGLESFSAFYDMAHTGCTGGWQVAPGSLLEGALWCSTL